MKLRSAKFFEVIFLFILSLTPLLWFGDNQIILGHDSGFRQNPTNHLRNLFYSWNENNNFGYDWTIFKGFLITQAPEAIFTILTGSVSKGQSLTLVLWFIAIGFSMYICLNAFFSDRKFWILRVFGSVFYIYNFFLLQAWFIAERAKFSIFAALPLGFLIIYKASTKEYSILKATVLFSLTLFIFNGGGAPTFFGSLILVYGLTIAYLTTINILKNGKKEIYYSCKLALSLIFGSILINAYWILPQIALLFNNYSFSLASFGGIQGILGWEATVSKNASFLNLFRLEGIPDWHDNLLHPYADNYIHSPLLIVLSFVFIIIILLALLFRRAFAKEERKDKLFFALFLILLVGFIFTAGSHPPFGFIYTLLIKFVPGFTIFRSSFYKFGPILWFGMVFLTAYSLNMLVLKFINNKFFYRLTGILAILFVLLYHYPFFTIDFFLWNKPFTTKVKIPPYVAEMGEYLEKKIQPDSRILLLPSLDELDTYKWGYLSLDSLPMLFANKSFVREAGINIGISNQIYKSIVNNDHQSFLYFTGMFGINKILWRDDLLSQDKNITSKDFLSTRYKLSHMKGVFTEKEIGEWTLYDIKNPYFLPHVYVPKTLSYSDFNMQHSFNSMEGEHQYTMLSSLGEKDEYRNSLNLFINELQIKAECVICSGDLIGFNQGKRILEFIPNVSLLPDSIFYPYVDFTEQQTLNHALENPAKLIDISLSLSNKRFAEYFKIINRVSKRRSQKLIGSAIKRYKENIDRAIEQVEYIDDKQRNDYYVKIYLYLTQQEQYITLPFFRSKIDSHEYLNLINYMDNYINYLKNKAWLTKSMNDLKYAFTITSAGEYDINLMNVLKYPQRIILDGNLLKYLNNISLKEGNHRIELVYPQGPNLLIDNGENKKQVINLKTNEKVDFGIEDFSDKNTYSISFEYKLIDGDSPNLSIYQFKKGSKDKQIAKKLKTLYADYNGVWNKFDYVFTPYAGFDQAGISIYLLDSKDSAKKSVFEIKNFNINEVSIPDISITKKINSQAFITPKISFSKINPTKYQVHVGNAKSAYALGFQEAYNANWKLYFVDNTKSSIGNFFSSKFLYEKNHFVLNQYTNAWVVEKKGTYDIIIEYFPQRASYAGFLISLVTFFGSIIYLFYRKFKNEK